ncbi:TPP-dependent pyruvate/acetoin dehydrogenase alpha subunit [Streptomyces sp. SAI-135]|jgi:pyruvate dehydrogenase E1 component alpha subunit|uniref:thiamine pyrophosphate-dependent dehydrogenase E1 component subunit alpha n=1 Tax=unclassified Streptomyces TaxID=2593676 RepID=UPI0024737B7A|nr:MULTISPECIES: thiamine pyrophosphate-dependent dehydrogenase E1 component subunit alpha [unclassified Streptomyces]MDH6521928.1 TPP-dependent pyruvate/acetoin dehydrogenase alpha subunit [Streptomyces sp. SAI-090]MDH6573297.1 TPP-dependent pyruvate/acetoin dehydrogenase alpha subunit [Streptomyces sp. SAI-117]MDH6613970.1 TPP-dependent pyruvate/acetoin dehydrogenase alpha subunit [Streptomyces sp. SAI-135]
MAPRKRRPTGVPADPGLLLGLFTTVARARALEDALAVHIRDHGFAGFWHPGKGQEGAVAGACAALRTDDYLFYQGRGATWPLAKGMGLQPIIGDLLGRVTGSTGGKGAGVPHWADPALGIMGEGATLGSVYPIAAGAALSAKMRGTDQVALADFGDGTSHRGTFHETLIQAASWKLPLVYFCENNGLAVSTRFEDVSPTPNVADRAGAYGIPGVVVDGQDAVEVHRVTAEAVERARAGEGPTLIEAKVTRVGGHWEGDAQQYRPDDFLKDYRDPLEILRAYLGDAHAETADKIVADAAAEVAEELLRAEAADLPDPEIITKDVFV